MEVENGNLLWFHRNETLDTVFSAITDRVVIQPDTWVETVVMYDSTRGRAVIYIDGQLVKEEISDQMKLSQDWGSFAGRQKFCICKTSFYKFKNSRVYFSGVIQRHAICLINAITITKNRMAGQKSEWRKWQVNSQSGELKAQSLKA